LLLPVILEEMLWRYVAKVFLQRPFLSLDGVASRWIVSASGSVLLPCTINSRRWQAIMEEVDKGCSEFSA